MGFAASFGCKFLSGSSAFVIFFRRHVVLLCFQKFARKIYLFFFESGTAIPFLMACLL